MTRGLSNTLAVMIDIDPLRQYDLTISLDSSLLFIYLYITAIAGGATSSTLFIMVIALDRRKVFWNFPVKYFVLVSQRQPAVVSDCRSLDDYVPAINVI